MFGGRDDGAKESSKKVVSVNMLTVYAKQLQLHVDTSSSNRRAGTSEGRMPEGRRQGFG